MLNLLNIDELINNEKFIYFLGYLWADGYIYKNEINFEIKKDDSEDIIESINFIKWNTYIKKKKLKNRDKIYESFQIRKNNKILASFLINNDYKSKSIVSPTKILNLIHDKNKYLFFRGYIDGDGCFSIKNNNKNRSYFSITSDIRQDWIEIEKLFNLLNIRYNKKIDDRENNKSSFIILSDRKQILLLGDYIYQHYNFLGLKRKYNTYIELKNRIVKINQYC